MGEGVVVRPDQVSLGVLVNAVPRDAVDDAVAVCGVGEKRSGGKLPAHVIMYLTLGLALFPEDDYEEVATRVTGSLDRWGCWNAAWTVPTASAITQARKRLGRQVFPELFERTCGPVAGDASPVAGMYALGTARGSFLRRWRLLGIDGFDRPTGQQGQRRRVRLRRLGRQPLGVPQGAGGRVGRVRHPRVRRRRGRCLLRGGED